VLAEMPGLTGIIVMPVENATKENTTGLPGIGQRNDDAAGLTKSRREIKPLGGTCCLITDLIYPPECPLCARSGR